MYSIPGYFFLLVFLGVICFQSLSCFLCSVRCAFQSVCQIQWHAALQHDLTAGKPLLISHAVAKTRLQFHETLAGFPSACFWAHFWLRANTNEWKHRKWKQIQKYRKKRSYFWGGLPQWQTKIEDVCWWGNSNISWLSARNKHKCHIRWEAEMKSLLSP